MFRARFPAVELDESQMVVDSKRIVTAGGTLAHVDLALWLVQRKSHALASMVSRYLVADARPSQAPYIVSHQQVYADPIVERFERYARSHLARFSMTSAARTVGASERTIERRVRVTLGKTPLTLVRDLRVELAAHLLKTTDSTIEEIATEVGYSDGATLRTLIRARIGSGVRELRSVRIGRGSE
jgi:transcriptional regulator GlxA family with amidase domain